MEYGKKFSEYIEEQNNWKMADERCHSCMYYYEYGSKEMCKVRDDVYPYGRFKKPVKCDVYEKAPFYKRPYSPDTIVPLILFSAFIFIFLMILNEILGVIL